MADHRLVKLGAADYGAKLAALFGPSLIGYWKGAEPSGSVALDSSGNGRNGVYTAVTLAQPGIGDGLSSVKYDGTTSLDNIYGASLAGAFNNQELTLMAWFQVLNAGVWTDAAARGIIRLGVDANNLVQINKSATSNLLAITYIAGAVIKQATPTYSATTWTHVAITVSKSNDRLRGYLNGVQQGADVTALGVWVGALASTLCAIGSLTSGPANVWSGFLAHVAVLSREAAANEIAAVAQIGGA